jgi:hypothetical protein
LLSAVAVGAMSVRLSAECFFFERPPLVVTGRICGTLINQSGGVWDGAEAILYGRDEQVVAKTVADSRGRFQFGRVPAGDYHVNVEGTRFSGRWVRLVRPDATACSQRIQVLANVGECLSDVSSGSGLRLRVDVESHVEVVVNGDAYDGEFTVTDENFKGQFNFIQLEPGRYHIEVRAHGYASRTINFSIGEFDVRTYRIALRRLPRK